MSDDDGVYEHVDYYPPTQPFGPTKASPTPTRRVQKRPPPLAPKPNKALYEVIPSSPTKQPSQPGLGTSPSDNNPSPPIPSPRPLRSVLHQDSTPQSSPCPIPPAPRRSSSLDDGKLYRIANEAPIEESLSLASFISKYASKLPLRVKVDKGFYGTEDRFVISAGDVYNIHFMKRKKTVWIKDGSGATYALPINSAVEFGILYDPNNNYSQASKGFTFPCVSDIIAQDPLPKLVRATLSYSTGDSKTSVEKNEVLIVQKAAKSGLRRRQVLKVVSLNSKEVLEKSLLEDCTGQFVTEPYGVRLYLPEIIQHMSDALPLKVLLYINTDTPEDFPRHLTSEVVTLTHSSIETSLISTTHWDGSYQPSDADRIPVDIPIDLDIEVTVIPSLETDKEEQLCSDTKNLYEGFDGLNVKTCGNINKESGTLLKIVRKGCEDQGLELQKPERIYDVILSPRNRLTEFIIGNSSSPATQRRSPTPERPPAIPERPKPPLTTDELAKQLSSLRALVSSLEDNSRKQFANLKKEVARIGPLTDNISKELEELKSEMKQLKGQVAAISPATGLEELDPEFQEQNRVRMRSFSPVQVLQLLEAMNLKQYQDKFMEEQIDGELLAECDEGILEGDLGITSKLHRSRLMKVVSGRQSAQNIIDGHNPYVEFKS